jgi:hypothetical protein
MPAAAGVRSERVWGRKHLAGDATASTRPPREGARPAVVLWTPRNAAW